MRYANQWCAVCKEAYNGVNGRYCRKLGRYVEYDREPKCQEDYDKAY